MLFCPLKHYCWQSTRTIFFTAITHTHTKRAHIHAYARAHALVKERRKYICRKYKSPTGITFGTNDNLLLNFEGCIRMDLGMCKLQNYKWIKRFAKLRIKRCRKLSKHHFAQNIRTCMNKVSSKSYILEYFGFTLRRLLFWELKSFGWKSQGIESWIETKWKFKAWDCSKRPKYLP